MRREIYAVIPGARRIQMAARFGNEPCSPGSCASALKMSQRMHEIPVLDFAPARDAHRQNHKPG